MNHITQATDPVVLSYSRHNDTKEGAMRRFALAALVAVVISIAFAAFSNNASAGNTKKSDNPPITLANVQYAYDQTQVGGVETTVANSNNGGKIQVAYTMPHGLTKSMKAKATTCLIAANDTRPARHGEKCGHIKIGTAIINSGTLITTGRFGMFHDTVHPGDVFYLVDGQWRKGKCGNKVWFKFSQPHPKGPILPFVRVQVVQYFSITVVARAKLTKSVHATASASCTSNSGAASATARADGTGTGEAVGSATARTIASARTSAIRAATQNVVSQEEALKASARANVGIKLEASAMAVVSCSTTPTTPQKSYILVTKSANSATCPTFVISSSDGGSSTSNTITVCAGGSSSQIEVSSNHSYTVSEACPAPPNSTTQWQCPGPVTQFVAAGETKQFSFTNVLVCVSGTTGTPPNCSTPTTPPVHFTNLSCQGQEEVTGGASSKLVCTVSNDNGGPISLSVDVLSNSGALLVSGIQCTSQGGTPTCNGAGTFEVRLKGVNEGTAPVYSDLRVVATSNGVSSSPFNQKYQIDPRCANFGC